VGKLFGVCLVALACGWSDCALAKSAAQLYRIVGIADGDTLTALSLGRRQVTCRLYGIDAPEKKQAYGQASKLSLAELTFGREAQIEIVERDRYGRSVCRIAVNGVDVNREQIVRGMAWIYRQYARDSAYDEAEAVARTRRIGIWREPEPTPPWDYRKHRRNRSA
jgi:micrococcal nuclease